MAGFLTRGLTDRLTCPAFSYLPEAMTAQKRTIRRVPEASARLIMPPLQWLPLSRDPRQMATNRMSAYENANPLYSRGVGCDQSARFGSTLRIPILILQALPFGTIRVSIDRP
jgi:hypothetical protein